MRRMGRHLLRDEEGVSAVIVAVLITVLIGFTALVVDIGSLALERRRLQTAADAGALAGVQELPSDTASADSYARSYAQTNRPGCTVDEVLIYQTSAPNDTIKVMVSFPSPAYFARIWGGSGKTIHATGVAQVQSPVAYGPGVMPMGIMSRDPSQTAGPFGYDFNEYVTLKEPANDGESGNFQFLSLTDPGGEHVGANIIRDALLTGGVDVPVYLDESYNTKTGINGSNVSNSINAWINAGHASCTFDQVVSQPDENGIVTIHDMFCHRLIVCPIIINPEYAEGDPLRYNWTEVNGSKLVQIIGFAYFFIEDVGSQGNDCYISGRFVRPVDDDELLYGALQPLGAVYYGLTE